MSLAFLPPPRAPRGSLSTPGSAFHRRCHPATGRENQLTGLSLAHFPSQTPSFGFCLCIRFTRHFARGSQNTQAPGKAMHPSAPRSLQKGAHDSSSCYGTSRITGSHPGVGGRGVGGVGVRAPWARAQLACVCPPPAGGRWRRKACPRMVVREKSHFK